ncbi:hypothetical protein CVD25_22365 [Bacillus canaveralius]|uniref:Uncharacterized protein n=1 Tax=Bacillus canaveralius TaxID=1403243 RepID=A0A2N5GIU4_9BACI|nr:MULTISPECIES: hypothetical protein [Bacillus]PLR80956.1 hypothetical protein CU635_16465 [Bacillus canaveralius]PLR86661.1 hypothetical protein CVD23_05865 [Bacillus sp. V33-4]PLR88584.1 hypothetical protein CVD25_22365 [Bacillus canaveralius]RSK44881.1 hypothetical protein EJA13_20475 [Bacillus canaveralius]
MSFKQSALRSENYPKRQLVKNRLMIQHVCCTIYHYGDSVLQVSSAFVRWPGLLMFSFLPGHCGRSLSKWLINAIIPGLAGPSCNLIQTMACQVLKDLIAQNRGD